MPHPWIKVQELTYVEGEGYQPVRERWLHPSHIASFYATVDGGGRPYTWVDTAHTSFAVSETPAAIISQCALSDKERQEG